MKKFYFLSVVFLASSLSVFAQTKEEAKRITENYDLKKIKAQKEFYLKKGEIEKKNAIEKAKINNWPLTVKSKNGGFMELMKLTPDGFPLYYSTDNANAAKSTRANHLNTGGSLGLTLNGQGLVARVWDGGTVRRTHNLFTNRVTTVDDVAGTTYVAHATHVTGTIMATNTASATKGMAWQADARTFNWTNDSAEALDEVQGGMLISNHSYGVPIISGTGVPLSPWYIGTYSAESYEWDDVAYLSPYYLMVVSAGNNGLDDNTDPAAFGFDKLTGNKVSKNNLVVANAEDASVDVNGNLTAPVEINSSSSQGPADDRRIKPDITGNGTAVLSCNSTSNTATTTMTGTSMASPNVAGTILLLQQHYKNLTNNFMKAATLKGLACHTADEAGNVGPDAVFGWGLLNAKKAAQTLTGNGLTSWVSEEVLNQGQTYTMNVKSDGVNPLMASITWTDVPGVVNAGERPINDATPALVNDLDIRVTRNATTYFPWKLDADVTAEAIRTGDNNVDNVEQVKIDAPVAGDYTITITHKGILQGGTKQNYSLVVTGITSSFSLNSTSSDLTVCSTQNAVYTFAYKQTGVGTTNFSAVGLPAGANAVFSPTSLNANGNVSMTISGLSGIVPGEYNVGILGNNGTETETRYRVLKVYNSTFQPTVLNTPANGQTGVSTSVILKWANNANAETFNVQVATDSNFTNIIANATQTENSFQLSGLNQSAYYYWRVTPSNRCGNGLPAAATVRNFQTGVLTCGFNFTATDFSNATIATTADASATVPVTVTGGLTVGDLNVNLNITHTYIQDMTIFLQGPASIGSPIVYLFREACGDNDNINCVVDDSGLAPACSGNPSVSGNVIPNEPLGNLNGLVADGIWTLHVEDPYNGDGGVVNGFGLSICKVSPSLGVNENEIVGLKVYPNPTKGTISIDLGENLEESVTTLSFHDIQGRQIFTKKVSFTTGNVNIDHLQNGVYLLTVENGSKKATKKIVLNK
ncbi:S8 family serine peptidase [Flavobacterium sp.]|uniref:S8 family serine peptidase n=1 Tax=Flavobacterium sp. TaxID=239 RepID=UPI003D6BC1A4